MYLSSSTRLHALLADVSTRFGKKLRVSMTGRRWFLPISKETKTRESSTLTGSATLLLSLCSTGYYSYFSSTQDMATPIKFNGRQYKESLLFFVKVLSPLFLLIPATIWRPQPRFSCCSFHRCFRSASRISFSLSLISF